MNLRKFGWIPDLPDIRDIPFTVSRSVIAKLPDVVDLRSKHTPVEDQGNLGSCTANAIAGMMEFLDKKGDGKFDELSRLFVYYYERERIGTIRQDSGAYLRDGIKVLAKKGYCTEAEWPYIIEKFKTKPPAACRLTALTRLIKSYKRLDTVDQMCACLAAGLPFIGGFTVYTNFLSEEVARTGVAKMPAAGEKAEGGHAVEFCGYNRPKKVMIARNSWGINWGQKGYFTIPFDYVANRNLSDDFWCVEK